ncbi:MAG: KEOPS complex subunit Cgi121 [Nitrososphaerota archaeon]|nr:KEOPS complex subunit Cgi121 [Candidatus Bathyarchaeota archaeon]MDW8022174.1 KEOPS complex subunit Cgi121 [Nitrososphaerota archaeon]
MLKHIREFRKSLAIAGFRNAKISDVKNFLEKVKACLGKDVEFQFFDAKLVATWQHLYFSSLNALKAFQNKENISKSLAMEAMLYASAQRQIQRAVELLGIKPNSSEIAVIIIGGDPKNVKLALASLAKLINAERDDRVLMLSEEKIDAIKRAFDISEVEVKASMAGDDREKAIVNLVIERMALLATQR